MIEFGPFRFDKDLGKLSKHGMPIRLRGMPLKILQHLVERPGEIVSRGELQRLLWGDAAFGDFEQGLNSAVNLVRKTLNDSADQPRYIETVPGCGYRFIGPIRTASIHDTNSSNAPPDLSSPAPGPNLQVLRAPESDDTSPGRNVTAMMPRWQIAAVLALAVLGAGAWWTSPSKAHTLIDGSTPSANIEANDQYNLAMNFLAFQNDIKLARKTFQHALELDSEFASARLQLANMMILEIYNGYANDESVLYQAEEELHRAEQTLPVSDGLLVAVQTVVYLAQGRLDRIPSAKLEEWWRKGGNNGQAPPVLVVILRILEGQIQEPLAIVRRRLERTPMENPTRMLLGELLRMQGDAVGGIRTLERVLQQAPRHPTPAWFLTMAYLDNGQPKQARELLEKMRLEFENNYMWRHAWAMLLATEGKTQEAQLAMDEATLKFARLTWAVTSATADFYALQGEDSKAIEWLQLAIARGDERVAYFRRNPRLAKIRNDARFQSLVKSVEARRK